MIDDCANLSRKEVAGLLRVSYSQTYNLEKSGALPPPRRVGKHNPRWSLNHVVLADRRLNPKV